MRKKWVTVVVNREELVAGKKRDGRNKYEPGAKQRLIDACLEPGVSVSGMALAHGLNTNVLRKWLTRARKDSGSDLGRRVGSAVASTAKLLAVTTIAEPATDALVPMTESSPTPSTARNADALGRINIEIGGARIIVDANVNATALSTVLDCLRGTNSR